jgi:hypothetical protein
MATSAQRVADFLALVDHPHLRATWDPGNEQGNPEEGRAFSAGGEAATRQCLESLRDMLRLV